MSYHHELGGLFQTSLDLELDLADCRGFFVRLSLTYDRRLTNTLVSHYIVCHGTDMHSLIYRRMAS